MIVDISYWKNELSALLQNLKESTKELRILDLTTDVISSPEEYARVNFEMEKALFFSGLAIRRILEADKSTREHTPNQIEWLARTVSNKLTGQNSRFQTRKPPQKPQTLSIWQFATELIHSEELEWGETEALDCSGFWLASENNRERGPIFVEWSKYEEILRIVINDQPDPFER